MNKYTASNGVKVLTLANGLGFQYPNHPISSSGIHDAKVVALREFFQHERDEELGRWRWPENPDFVVYLDGHPSRRSVTIFVEKTGGIAIGMREDFLAATPDDGHDFRAAARAYFEAHPAPKPWHEATDGHLWLIRFDDFPETDVSALVKGGRFIYNDHCHEGVAELTDPMITAARRIWPESD